MKEVLFPLTLVPKRAVEVIRSIASSKPVNEGSFIDVSVFINGLASTMRLCSLPMTFVLNDIVVLFTLIVQSSESMKFPIEKFSVVPGAVAEIVNAVTAHQIFLPITAKFVPIGPCIDTITLLLLGLSF
jgi:hypothetical protein